MEDLRGDIRDLERVKFAGIAEFRPEIVFPHLAAQSLVRPLLRRSDRHLRDQHHGNGARLEEVRVHVAACAPFSLSRATSATRIGNGIVPTSKGMPWAGMTPKQQQGMRRTGHRGLSAFIFRSRALC